MFDLIDYLDACNSTCVVPLHKGSERVRLVRHADSAKKSDRDLDEIVRLGYFEDYQARQGREIFENIEFIVSFMGERGGRSRFMGVYNIRSVRKGTPPFPKDFPYRKMPSGNYMYKFVDVPGFEELKNRLIIDWGSNKRTWVQYLSNKKVIELYPEGYSRDFPGYDKVLVQFAELERIVKFPDANRSWHDMLSAVAGVYLITDTGTGQLYIGSAYGQQGIFGRWSNYVGTRHCNNTKLKELLKEHPRQYLRFRFSILRTMSQTSTKTEVIQVESLYKEKLGTRAFGLNLN